MIRNKREFNERFLPEYTKLQDKRNKIILEIEQGKTNGAFWNAQRIKDLLKEIGRLRILLNEEIDAIIKTMSYRYGVS